MVTLQVAAPDPDALMSETETRQFLGGLSESTMRNMRRDGRLPFVKLNGRTVRYKRRDVLKVIEQNTVAPKARKRG